jgi:hypothetical protein
VSAIGNVTWKVMGITSGLLAAKASRSAAEALWRRTRGGDPPRNPAAYGTSWGEALAWAAASGVTAGVARMLATRAAAGNYRRAAGHLPAGLEEVGP